MSDWQQLRLGDVLTLQRGFDITKKQQRPGPIPVVSSSGISSTHAESRAEGPGVVIGRKGSLGTTFFLHGPFWPHDTTLWVKDFKGNDPFFCYLLLKGLRLSDLDAGSSNPTLNRNHAHMLEVATPSVVLQRRIAAILSAFDELIEINERRIVLLEELARSLYREWFVHFRFPGRERSELAESPLGPIPSGWSVRSVGEVSDLVRGRSYKRAELADTDGVAFLNLKCVDRGGGFRRSGLKRYTGPYKETQKALAGDILVAVTDMTQERRIVAQAFRMPDLEEPFAVPSLDLALLKPFNERLRPFLYAAFRYSGFSDIVRQHANGVNVLHLAVERILEHPLVVPSEEILGRFSEAVESLFDGAEALADQNRALAAARDLLLPRLVSGRLDISDVDLGDLLPG